MTGQKHIVTIRPDGNVCETRPEIASRVPENIQYRDVLNIDGVRYICVSTTRTMHRSQDFKGDMVMDDKTTQVELREIGGSSTVTEDEKLYTEIEALRSILYGHPFAIKMIRMSKKTHCRILNLANHIGDPMKSFVEGEGEFAGIPFFVDPERTDGYEIVVEGFGK